MLPKSGSRLPSRSAISEAELAAAIGRALTGELGGSRRAAKTIMAWTGVSGRTARSWLQGGSCPGGRHLLLLVANCDAVLRALLRLSGRERVGLGVDLAALETRLAGLLEDVRALRGDAATRPR
jgi:hypothetical protein